MFSSPPGLLACRDNILQRTDPRTKLVVAAAAILCVILSAGVFLPFATCVVCLAAMVTLRIPPWLVALRLAGPLGLISVLVLLLSCLVGSTPHWVISVGSWRLTATREGLQVAQATAARVCGVVNVVLLLSLATPAPEMLRALRWFRLPQGWGEFAILMYRYTFRLPDLTADLVAAHRLRLELAGLRRSLASMGNACGTGIVRSIEQAVRAHEAMILCGSKHKFSSDPMPPFSPWDCWIMALAIPLLMLCCAVIGRTHVNDCFY